MCSPTTLQTRGAKNQSSLVKAQQNYAQGLSHARQDMAYLDRWTSADYQEALRGLNQKASKDKDLSRRAEGRRVAKGARSGLTRSGSRLDSLFDAKAREEKSILDALNEGRRAAKLRKAQRQELTDKQYKQRRSALDLDLQQAQASYSAATNPLNAFFG